VCDAQSCTQALAAKDSGPGDLGQLDSATPPSPRGYRVDPSARTWPDFQYATAAERRGMAEAISQAICARSVVEQEVRGPDTRPQ
jgi:hypothetical protein